MSACGGGEGRFFPGCLIFLCLGIPPCSVELPLACGAVLLERGCVLLGVRVSSAMRFHGVGVEDCVFHWLSKALSLRNEFGGRWFGIEHASDL